MNSEKTHRVLWTQSAQQDLARIIEFIARDNEANSKKLYKTVVRKAENLWQLPSQGRIAPELMDFGVEFYRELVISSWRLVYKVETERVLILAIFDGRRNVEDILFERLINDRGH